MLVPAQQLPISLIGSMWNLISCWSCPEEELYVWEESTELYCNISLKFEVMYLSWKTEKKSWNCNCNWLILYDSCTRNCKQRYMYTDTHIALTRQALHFKNCTYRDNIEGKETHCTLCLLLCINIVAQPSRVQYIMNWLMHFSEYNHPLQCCMWSEG